MLSKCFTNKHLNIKVGKLTFCPTWLDGGLDGVEEAT